MPLPKQRKQRSFSPPHGQGFVSIAVAILSWTTGDRTRVFARPNVRVKPRVPTPAETAQGPGTGGVRPTRLRRSCLAKSTTYAIGSWRASDNGRPPSPGWRKCTACRRPGLGGLPLALRLNEGLDLTGQAGLWNDSSIGPTRHHQELYAAAGVQQCRARHVGPMQTGGDFGGLLRARLRRRP